MSRPSKSSSTASLATFRHKAPAALFACVAAVATVAACGGGAGTGSGGGDKVAVSLITKDSTNPFFVAMQKGAKAEAAKEGVDLT
ncbi:sugar ABC transporter substrate-binding protein, partial [Kineococcus sp. NPDC059986]